jgi:sugar/nucleoside kinase (ribokinase family)
MSVFTALGAHIVDVLGRPVGEIPLGQGGQLLTEIKITAAGAAGGTAVDLARLGGTVRSVGAIGADNLGMFLLAELSSAGIDVSRMVVRSDQQTSATILPIRANGERPSFHVPGATATLTAVDVPLESLAGSHYLHVGGPDVLGDFAVDVLPQLLRQVREAGTVTSADLLSRGSPQTREQLSGVLAQIDHLLINDQQASMLTGCDDPVEAAVALLAAGPTVVVVSMGAEGGVLTDANGAYRFPAMHVSVVDTTGCGDGFSAGYLRALSLGWSPRRACGLGTACAATVATVLGSDALTDLPSALNLLARNGRYRAFLAATPTDDAPTAH